MEKDYDNYEASDFLNDSSFLKWMRHENKENDAFWENWMREHPERSEAIRSVTEHYHLLTSFKKLKPQAGDSEQVWEGIEDSLNKQAGSKVLRMRMLKWAVRAAVILLFIGGWFAYKQLQLPKESFVIVKAMNGKKKIMLADSSLVVLNANAVLKYHPDNCRELWLTGEAFFEVKHHKIVENEAVPFIIHAGKEKVAVLGTSFTIKTIRDAARVVLLNGKVKASVGRKAITMRPGDKTEWKDDHFFREKVNPQLYVAWKDGEFHFDHTSLKELAEVVKDVYGYDMIIKDPASWPVKYISGRISSENEEILWNSLSVLLNVRVIKHNKQVLLIPK